MLRHIKRFLHETWLLSKISQSLFFWNLLFIFGAAAATAFIFGCGLFLILHNASP
jgi:hypothetical protein